MREELFEPIPFMIDFGERGFILFHRDDEVDISGIDKLLAMTPLERLRWNAWWCERTRNALRPLTGSEPDNPA